MLIINIETLFQDSLNVKFSKKKKIFNEFSRANKKIGRLFTKLFLFTYNVILSPNVVNIIYQ